jgi:hypothetical protein
MSRLAAVPDDISVGIRNGISTNSLPVPAVRHRYSVGWKRQNVDFLLEMNGHAGSIRPVFSLHSPFRVRDKTLRIRKKKQQKDEPLALLGS